MNRKRLFITLIMFHICFWLNMSCYASSIDDIKRLQQIYPDQIKEVNSHYIVWKDGKRMLISGSIPLFDRIRGIFYRADQSLGSISNDDVKNDDFEPFFRKMYGNSAQEVKQKLRTIYWMPNVFGNRYPLRVTTINDVDKKMERISAALERLPVTYYKYLDNPAGSFYWRKVAGQSYLSTHSFGIAIDINSHYSNYWLWDIQKLKRRLTENDYQNKIPMKIIEIFEKEGFFWGGRWFFYDTMHFEYRPDLVVPGENFKV